MPLFLVSVLSTFRDVYAIEAKTLEHAYDELVMTEHNRGFSEVTQRWLGEQILDGREITPEEFKQQLEAYEEDDREMSSHWMGDKLIHKLTYEDSTGE